MANIQIDKDCDLDAIKHSGIIKDIDSKQYYISIIAQSACAACHAKGVCNVSELQQEIVEVSREQTDNYKIGDKVEILMEKSLGPQAVMVGYFFPFLLLLVTLIITLSFMKNQGIAGLISIAILVPYYFILYTLRDRLKNKFKFRIR